MLKPHLESVFVRCCLVNLSCIDKRSRNAPGQHGGSLQTRFIQSMRAHVITIYGKRTGRP